MTESKAWEKCPACGGYGWFAKTTVEGWVTGGIYDRGASRVETKDCPTCLAHFKAVSDAVQAELQKLGIEKTGENTYLVAPHTKLKRMEGRLCSIE